MEQSKEEEAEANAMQLQEYFNTVLSPMEPTIMRAQSVLVWENPIKSAIMIVVVHGLFWLFTFGDFRFYSTLCTVVMVIYFLHTWKKKIWPEIRVPPKSPESDEWTPVHPRLLSVPELCKHLVVSWAYVKRCTYWWTNLRATRPLKFCIETSFIFSCTAMLGYYISGTLLAYTMLMSLVLWPCMQYHNLLQKIYLKLEPVFMKLDYSIKVKNKWRYSRGDEDPTSPARDPLDDDDLSLTRRSARDHDSDLEDFLPSNTAMTAALARAITDSEDESLPPASPPTQHLSKEPSVTNSEDETPDNGVEDFALSIDMMPSFDETADYTDDELLGFDTPAHARRRPTTMKTGESIQFINSHFNESDDDEDTVRQDSSHSTKHRTARRPRREKDATQTLAENIVAQTLTSVMTSAVQNTVMGALQNMAGKSDLSVNSPDGSHVESAHNDSDDDEFALDSSTHSYVDGRREWKPSEDASSLNIEEEFDFLDEYEMGSSPEGK